MPLRVDFVSVMVELLFGLLKKSALIVLFLNETYVVVAQNNRLDEAFL